MKMNFLFMVSALFLFIACDSGNNYARYDWNDESKYYPLRQYDQNQNQTPKSHSGPNPDLKKQEKIICPFCNGSGRYKTIEEDIMSSTLNCPTCMGTGYADASAVKTRLNLESGSSSTWSYENSNSSCHQCNGSGKCSGCAGRGEYRSNGYYYDCPSCRGTGKCLGCHELGHI